MKAAVLLSALLLAIAEARRVSKPILQRDQYESDLNPNGESVGSQQQCQVCKMSIWGIQQSLGLQATQTALQNYLVVSMCNNVVLNSTICPGMVETMLPVALDALFGSWLSIDYFCEEVAPACPYSSFIDSPPNWFTDKILEQVS